MISNYILTLLIIICIIFLPYIGWVIMVSLEKGWSGINKTYYMGIGGFIFIIITLTILYFLFKEYYDTKDQIDNKKKQADQLSMVMAEASKCPGPIELEGKVGPEGPPGPAGGTYIQTGPLRNLANTNLVVDRFDCFGNTALAYLTEQNYKPQQTWTLKSTEGGIGGTLENQYGGCLTVDELNNVHLTTPSGCQNANKWIFTTQGQLKPTSNTKKCLSFTNAGILKNVQKKQPICSKGSLNPSNNLMKLQLIDCQNQPSNEQQWAFY